MCRAVLLSLIGLLVSSVTIANDLAPESDVQPVSFARDVIPLLTKAGCNSGACHGAAAGRGYLQLSLYGSNPSQDFEAIVHAPAGRLLDFANVDASLFLQKPSGQLEHGGETRIELESDDYRILRRWIADGSAPPGELELAELHVLPTTRIQLEVDQQQQLELVSVWESAGQDAETRPVQLDWLSVEGATWDDKSNEGPSLELSKGEEKAAGIVVRGDGNALVLAARKPGYWPVTLRYGPETAVVQVWVRPSVPEANVARDSTGLDSFQSTTPNSSVDGLVSQAASWIGETLGPLCSPELLTRRLWVDLLGEHPSLDAWQADARRIASGDLEGVVDRLLDDPRFYSQTANQITSWIDAASTARESASRLRPLIAEQLAENPSLQQLAREMLLVSSGTDWAQRESAQPMLSAFHRYADNPRSRSELVASVWLGVRIGCAQCHDHPLDKWTQDDYFALSACWSEIDASGGMARRVLGRTTTDLRTGRDAVPRLPDSDLSYKGIQPADHALINWLTNSENELFSRNIANRVWYWMTGEGIVDEVDDFRATNPPINPLLLEHLATHLQQNDFSVRDLVREIVLSDAYARQTNSDASRLPLRLGIQRRAKPIPLRLEELVAQLFESPTKEAVNNLTQTGMMMAVDTNSACSRGEACTDPFGESIQMIVGEALNKQIRRGVEQLFAESGSSEEGGDQPLPVYELLNKMHLRIFCREIEPEQLAKLDIALRSTSTRNAQLELVEDIVWSWVVSDAFVKLY